jgi:bifunctional UDP-N-acetylglucosamine pyrophosphorylase/glucosamine-1-phosphate N-acetyltransferase
MAQILYQQTSIIILAAGKGTRMKSDLPKCLNKIASFEMIKIIVDKAQQLAPQNISLVISENMQQQIAEIFPEKNINFIIQKDRLGTGHAVKTAFEYLSKSNSLGKNSLILYGDCPNVSRETLKNLLKNLDSVAVLGFECKKENTYGRLIVANENHLEAIVETKDANAEQKKITLCNSGIMALKSHQAQKSLSEVTNKNKSGEYYLTDLVKITKNKGQLCSFFIADESEVLGVNSKNELAVAEKIIRKILCEKLMENGVTIIDPATTYLSYDTKIGKGSTIYPNVFFGSNVKIGENVEVKSFSHIEGAEIGSNCAIGPFARIRPQTNLGENVKIGNFVEIKNSSLACNAKAGHLSYIGDAKIGERSNIGAGTITCNYDGINKHKTTIAEDVFIGSNSALIAPVCLEKNSMIAAGSVITKNVAENELSISRTKQIHIKDGSKKFKK